MNHLIVVLGMLGSLNSVAAKCVSLWDLEPLRKTASTGVPINPCTFKPLSEAKQKKIDSVVIAAHPDDETIGMAGWMANRATSGHPVMVEIMTDGLGSYVQTQLMLEGAKLSNLEFGDARLRELVSSLRVLKVSGIRYHNQLSLKIDPKIVEAVIEFWKLKSSQGVLFNANAGKDHDFEHHPDHEVLYQALKKADIPNNQKLWSLLYVFRTKKRFSVWPASQVFPLEPMLCEMKRAAMKEYAVSDSDEGRYAIGWTRSTPDVFRKAYKDCSEYHVLPDQAPFQWPR
jgi:LmbE family N-acetylglucosaminyl deacetylase